MFTLDAEDDGIYSYGIMKLAISSSLPPGINILTSCPNPMSPTVKYHLVPAKTAVELPLSTLPDWTVHFSEETLKAAQLEGFQ